MCDIMISHLQGRVMQFPIGRLRDVMVHLTDELAGGIAETLDEVRSSLSNIGFNISSAQTLLQELHDNWQQVGHTLSHILSVEQRDMITEIIQHIVDASFHMPVAPGDQETFASHVFLADRNACQLYQNIIND